MSVDTSIPEGVSLFGKELDDLQENIVIGDTGISGTLKYVTGYTGFSGDPDLQQGNFLALHVNVPDDATVTVKLTNTVTLDEDRTIVLRIADKSSQTITIVVSKAGAESITKTFSLTGLTCNES